MHRRVRRFGGTLLAVASIGALLGACRTPVVQAACDVKLVGSSPGTLDPAIVEASGLAVSAKNVGTLWVHNDSGDSARLFAITESGVIRKIYALSGATAVDWEDLALGRGPIAGQPYLYAADIGDNLYDRTEIVVYRVAEPAVTGSGTQTLTGVDKLTLQYPDGANDAEALMVDPRSGEIYVVQKSLTGGPVGVYRAPANLAGGSTTVMTRVGTVTFPSGLANAVTAADISADGNSIALRTYGGVHLWSRPGETTVIGALNALECAGPVPAEGQGETVAFRPDGRAYYTVSEGVSQPLHRFEIAAPAP